MAVTIEDILLARAAQDEADRPSTENVAIGGSILGSLGGVAAGSLAHEGDKLVGSARRLATRAVGGNPVQPGLLNKAKPGYRMAGGLVGAILGGALGAGARELMVQESPAARVLARIQTTGEMTPSDEKMLEDILADTYSNTLGM